MADQRNTTSLSEMPADELARYGDELGLDVSPKTPRGELLRVVRERQELLVELDRQALLDIIIWARRPVRESASKEQLVREIARIRRTRCDGLSDAGLRALARLRGGAVGDGDDRKALIRHIKRAEGFWQKVGRKSRRAVGGVIAQWWGEEQAADGDYRFLPEAKPEPGLKEQIEDEGVVGGIARKLRGVADDYVHDKLDEIERRIDRKLDEIDGRLAEWRDREITNRLKIIKITLAASVLVALLSLGYSYLVRQGGAENGTPAPSAPAQGDPGASGPAPASQRGSRRDDGGAPMYERLSKRMEEIVRTANEIAREYDQEYVGTEHVLLAILREGTGVGASVLKARGLSEARVKKEVDALIQHSLEETWVFGRLPGSPHFKNVMARAIEAASALSATEVCSEHLLIGLLAEEGSVAQGALHNLGITVKGIHADIVTFAERTTPEKA